MLAVVDRQRPMALKNVPYFACISTNDHQSSSTTETVAMKTEPTDSYASTSADAGSVGNDSQVKRFEIAYF